MTLHLRFLLNVEYLQVIFPNALRRGRFQRDYSLLWIHQRGIRGDRSLQRLRRRRDVNNHHRVRRSGFSDANELFRLHRHVGEGNHRRVDAQRRQLCVCFLRAKEEDKRKEKRQRCE